MAANKNNVTLRSDITRPLSHAEMDANFAEVVALIDDANQRDGAISDISLRQQTQVYEAAVFGHSWAFLCHSGTAPNSFLKLWGVAQAIQAKLGGDVVFPQSLNYGVAGNTTAEMLARTDAAIADMQAKGCQMVVIPGLATNDRTASTITLKDSVSNAVTIIHKFKAAGIQVVLLSDAPRGGASALTGQALADHKAFYDWQVQSLSKSCAFVDIWEILVDASSEIYAPLAGVFYDGIHLSQIGAELVGSAAAPVVRRLIPTGGKYGALFDALVDADACVVPNAKLTGVSGAIAGNAYPVAGSVIADGWNAMGQNTVATMSTTWYKEVVDGDEWQCVRIQGTTSASAFSNIQLYRDVDLATLQVGDKVISRATVSSQGAGIVGLSLEQYVPANPAYYALVDGDFHDGTQAYPDKPLTVARVSPVYTHNVNGSTTVVLRELVKVTFAKGATVDVVVKIKEVGVFKVNI